MKDAIVKPTCYGQYDSFDVLATTRRDCRACGWLPECVPVSATTPTLVRELNGAVHTERLGNPGTPVNFGDPSIVERAISRAVAGTDFFATLLEASDGSTASYYELPAGATELQDLISYRNMNAQMGEVGRAWYRYGQCPHSPKMRELKKMKFYIEAEIARIEKYGDS